MEKVKRYRCKYCNYIYSPLRGEPHRGIPAGTAFEDLPEDYICPVCGATGKGPIGAWGFEPWEPTRYVCKICGYVYDKKRGEPPGATQKAPRSKTFRRITPAPSAEWIRRSQVSMDLSVNRSLTQFWMSNR